MGRSMLPRSLVPPRRPPQPRPGGSWGLSPEQQRLPGLKEVPGGGVGANEGPSEGGHGLLMRASLFV